MISIAVEVHRAPVADAMQYMKASEHSTIFHEASWATVLASSYGHETLFFVARSHSSVRGVFVVVRQRVWPLGEKWVALPYQFYGGAPIAEDDAAAAALIRAAVLAARASRARYLEVRSSRFHEVMEAEGLARAESGLQVTNLDLRTHHRRMIRRGTLREIRYAEESGVVVEPVSAREGMSAFLAPHLRDMRDLGTPQAGRAFFEGLIRELPDAVHIVVARLKGVVVGSLMVLGDTRVAFARGSAGTMTPLGREHYLSKALLYGAIEAARARGVACFHLGITWEGDTGLSAYKAGWGGITAAVDRFIAPLRSEAPKTGDYLGGYHLARSVWRRMPMLIAGPVGHHVTRWIG